MLVIGMIFSRISGQAQYNHPELEWKTFETAHFKVHFYDGTEGTAREGAAVAETIYPYVTTLYQYEPPTKTHLVFVDTDDISNGITYYYDNKIVIWATPLDFELRGSHRWLQNVITHEFVHIVSIQKAMKTGLRIPGAYLQWIGYEPEKRKDVLYGYPNLLVSYPIPGTVVPPWLAEGVAQFMYQGADWDNWDTHRDMLLRDRVLHGKLLTLTEMNTFGKRGIGNESTYNAGYALTRYIAVKYGPEKLRALLQELSRPLRISVTKAMEKSIGLPGEQLYADFKATLEERYRFLTGTIRGSEVEGRILVADGTANLHPVWAPDGKRFAYLSNKENDFFGQTDLFVYDLESGEEEKIADGVHSAPTWHPSGHKIYYSRKPDYPDKTGSKYYDLFEYDFRTEKETRLTQGTRGFSPVYLAHDSSLAYIASHDGIQNIYIVDLANNQIRQITGFEDRRILHSLEYDPQQVRLLFDYTYNHFRDIGYVSFQDSIIGELLTDPAWDERDMTVHGGTLIYTDDRSGIFNLYYLDQRTGRQGYITNVLGGAFMPSVNARGQVLYALYEDGGYKIALLDSMTTVPETVVGYGPTYFSRNNHLHEPLLARDTTTAKVYEDQFPTMFLLPKLMVDYGTFKPGFYFYSSEILDRLTLFGGASVNTLNDLDLFFLFEFRRFYPTLFLEAYYLTRNIQENNLYSVYELDDNLRFRLIQFRGGLRWPILGIHSLESYLLWQRYRAFIKERVVGSPLEVGLAYDYYRGIIGGLRWTTQAVKPRVDGDINPSNGWRLSLDLAYEDNDFITGLNLSDAGTLVPEYSKTNDLTRLSFEGEIHWEIPKSNRWTLSFETLAGWLSNTSADSFFNFFGGGLTGLQGYPYYSIEGNRLWIGRLAFRLPLIRERHYPLGWFILQNSVIGLLYQGGDAWSDAFSYKHSVGIQWRFNGYSFYNFPTAIGLEVHRGLSSFVKEVNGNANHYGNENRFYITVLFGF
jgi:hypothetical protein